jgi:hypothetical protein
VGRLTKLLEPLSVAVREIFLMDYVEMVSAASVQVLQTDVEPAARGGPEFDVSPKDDAARIVPASPLYPTPLELVVFIRDALLPTPASL